VAFLDDLGPAPDGIDNAGVYVGRGDVVGRQVAEDGAFGGVAEVEGR
jgi:hypothetical protein